MAARASFGQRCRAAHTRPAHPPSDPRRRQHAGVREELESRGNNSTRRIFRDFASGRTSSRTRRGARGSFRETSVLAAIEQPMPTFIHVAFECWTFPVSLTLATFLAAFLYLRGWLHLHSSSVNTIQVWRAGSFLLGLFLICAVLGSPLGAFDEMLLTVHM